MTGEGFKPFRITLWKCSELSDQETWAKVQEYVPGETVKRFDTDPKANCYPALKKMLCLHKNKKYEITINIKEI